MALVVGHSQTKYLSDYLCEEKYSVFSYPGYRSLKFLTEDVLFDVIPFFSVIVVVTGANDIGAKTPEKIADDVVYLCNEIHNTSPSVTVMVSTVLPRCQNKFDGCRQTESFISRWNADACDVNNHLRNLPRLHGWIRVIEHPEFHTLFGTNKQLLSKDGLHLSYEGTHVFADNIDRAVQRLDVTRHAMKRSTTINLERPESKMAIGVMGPRQYSEVVSTTTAVTTVSRRSANRSDECMTYTGTKASPNVTAARSEVFRVVSPQANPPRQVARSKVSRHVVDVKAGRPIKKTTARSEVCRVVNPKANLPRQVAISTVIDPPASSVVNKDQLDVITSKTQEQSSSHQSRKKSRQVATKKKKTVMLIESDTRFYLSCDTTRLVGGGNGTPMFTKTDRILTHHEAGDIMQQNLPDSITYEPPYRPEPGSVYVFDDSGDPKRKEDWRADGYTWRDNGRRVYTSDGKTIQRIFFKICNQGDVSEKFQKHVFRFTNADYNGRTVMVYFGEKEAYKALPHGNRKKNSRQFKRTMPSVIGTIKSEGLAKNPTELADKIKSEASPESKLRGIKVPRNGKQVRNIQTNMRKEKKLSHDALYGLHLLVSQLDDYIMSIQTTPDLEVVVGNTEIMSELNRLLQLKDTTTELYYDTTFNMGDFYVSALACRHPMFKTKPIIPVAFMIHERKFQKCHEQFIDILKSKIPKLSEKKVCVVTDRETGIMNAFEEKLKNCTLLICWNHILNDIKFWLSKHGGKSSDKRVYDAQVRQLMHSATREEFDLKYNEIKAEWSGPFVTYFEENIYQTIVTYAGRWVLEPLSMYCSYSGITNNVAESLNAKLKRLVEYQEKAIDDIVLYLNYLQGNYHSDLIRAFCGESEWTLLEQYTFAARDPDTVIMPQNVCHPDKMINLIKAELSAIINVKKQTEDDKESDSDNLTENPDMVILKNKQKKVPMSQRSLAVKTISENGVVLVPQMGAFMVKGNSDNNYSVTLFPKESCSCPATSRCYHIMAAMLSIGMDIPNEKKVFNLTQLRKNCRPRNAKKCGTKKGRIGDTDFEIVAAPDSEMKTSNISTCTTPKFNFGLNTASTEKARKSLKFDMSTPKTPFLHKQPGQNPRSSSKKRILEQNDTYLKIPKMDPDLSVIKEVTEHEITTLEISSRDNSQSTVCVNNMWSEYLELRNEDIDALKENKKLNSNHMEAVNKLLRNKVGACINGLQLTEKVPMFCQTEKRWNTKISMDPVQSPACQIHHNHNDHWVSSVYHNGSIYLLDSLGSDRPTDKIIPNGLMIQLSQMYGRDKTSIKIKVPTIIKQNNSIDCGLYAIAFVTSYCLRKKLCFDLIFDCKKLRSHLLTCFERQEMTEFPLTDKKLSSRRKTNTVEIEIENYCVCNLPECVDTVMVQCDKCANWFHKSCINAPSDISTSDQDFTCGFC